MQIFEGRICPPPEGYITIAVARFNKTITQRLLDGALAKLRQHRVLDKDIRVVWVPGAYELPFVASYFARDAQCLAVICLGAVIKGETTHDQHINRSVSMAIGDIASRFGTPVIFGVLTCDNIEQANARSGMIESVKDKILNPAPGNKGAEAAEAALEMIDLLTELPEIESSSPFPEILSRMLAGATEDDEDYEDDDDDDDDDDDGNDDDDNDGGFYFPPQFKFVKKSTKKKKK
ncbi:MAG: 6,7-dimethyl-8-ribityllumazine synthase [Planctomycetaceae bacterium]|jgi:6,7-dimethyl-8-ribityllumazine synthase|nr:6,7-dimethyl-8-ribityllumazine synthase [Planctomycetaceae bacterium]